MKLNPFVHSAPFQLNLPVKKRLRSLKISFAIVSLGNGTFLGANSQFGSGSIVLLPKLERIAFKRSCICCSLNAFLIPWKSRRSSTAGNFLLELKSSQASQSLKFSLIHFKHTGAKCLKKRTRLKWVDDYAVELL